MLSQEMLRVIFLAGFVLQVIVAAWAIVTLTRMRRQQAITLAILNALAARSGLQRDTDKIESGAVPQSARDRAPVLLADVDPVLLQPPPRRGWFAGLLDRRKR